MPTQAEQIGLRLREFGKSFGTLKEFSLGGAVRWQAEIEREAGASERVSEYFLGPSVQWRPLKKAHIDIEPLIGVTEESKKLRMFIVFGWDF